MGPEQHAELGMTAVLGEGANGLPLPGVPLTPEFRNLHLPGMEFLSVLGRGGMGVVFLARQERLDRLVAVKMLAVELASNQAFVSRLEREALTLATLNHPNVVGCHDMISTEQGRFLVMEYVPGQLSVGGLLLRFHKLTEASALRIAADVALGLAGAQEKGITHRDIKPDNLQFHWDTRMPPHSPGDLYRFPTSRVMICDFGIALSEHTQDRHVGNAIGSPLYMAPEQCATEGVVDHRADIYALGTTLYHMLTGAVPFAGKTREETLALKAGADIPDPRERERTVSEQTARIVCRMGRWQPGERYDSYAELTADLEAAARAADPASFGLRARMPRTAFLLGLVVGGIVFFTVGAVIGGRRLAQLFVSPPVSRSASLGYWDGGQSPWRVAPADAETATPAIGAPGGAKPLVLRQKLGPGCQVKLKTRIPGTGSLQISLVDGEGTERWWFQWKRWPAISGYRCGAEESDMPLPEIKTPGRMDWLDLEFRLGSKRVVLLVNDEMTSVVPLKEDLYECRLSLHVTRGEVAEFRDVFIIDSPKD